MKALTDPTPVIDQEQFESDRDVFMANAEEWRKEQNRKRSRKAAAEKKLRGSKPVESADTFEPEPLKGRRQICDVKVAEAKELRSLGWSDADICKQLHIGRDTLVRHLGPPQRKHTQRLPDAERREKQAIAKRLIEQENLNYSQIAERVGVSKQSVRNWFPQQRKAA